MSSSNSFCQLPRSGLTGSYLHRNDLPCFWLQLRSRRGQLDVHEFEGSFQERPAVFKMTSVIGHVLSIDFLPQFQNWETTHPASLFDAPTKKSEANPKVEPSVAS